VNKCRDGPTSTTSKDGDDAAAARARVGVGAARGGDGDSDDDGDGGKERTSAIRLARRAVDTCRACAFDKSRHSTSARPTAEVCPAADDGGDGGGGERASRAAAERILRRRLRLRLGHNLPPPP